MVRPARARRHRFARSRRYDLIRLRERSAYAGASAKNAPLELHPLIAVARRYLGRGNFTGYREAWCADAVNAWLRAAGLRPNRSHRAIDFASYGRASAPRVGAIAVLRHHVGLVAGFSRGRVLLLSGNHSHRVAYGLYSARKILAYRQPV